MKRRSKAGGEPIKGRRRKAPEPKRRNAPKVATRSNSSSTGKETEVARLTHELREALEQQTATSEVLQVISSSPGDLQPVFATMLEKAVRICDAKFGNIYRWDGDALHLVATHNTPPAFAEARRRSPFRPGPKTPTGRMIANKSGGSHRRSACGESLCRSRSGIVAGVELGGVRTVLMVPMLKEDELIGAFSLYRQEVRPFTDKQIALVTELRRSSRHRHRERAAAQRTAGNRCSSRRPPRRYCRLSQAHPATSSRCLRQSFRTQHASARPNSVRFTVARAMASAPKRCTTPPPAYEEARAGILHPPPRTSLWRAANTKQAVQIADVRLEQGYIEGDPFVVTAVALGGYRSVLNVPMLQ